MDFPYVFLGFPSFFSTCFYVFGLFFGAETAAQCSLFPWLFVAVRRLGPRDLVVPRRFPVLFVASRCVSLLPVVFS